MVVSSGPSNLLRGMVLATIILVRSLEKAEMVLSSSPLLALLRQLPRVACPLILPSFFKATLSLCFLVSEWEEMEHFLLTGKETRHTLLNRLLVDWL